MTFDNKKALVTTLEEMLLNDLASIFRSKCEKHGVTEVGPPANFTCSLMCLTACEVFGMLFRSGPVNKAEAVRQFMRRVGALAGDRGYGQLAGPLFGFFRHGIAHSFLPLSYEGVSATVTWYFRCVDCLDAADSEVELKALRQTVHLVTDPSPWAKDERVFRMVPQVLYIDVRRAVKDCMRSLNEGAFSAELFEANFDWWIAKTRNLEAPYMNAAERKALALRGEDA